MPPDPAPYATAKAVHQAISSAAAHLTEVSDVTAHNVIKLAYTDRFLSRIFSEGEESEWVLRGGTAMLARIPSARSTNDVDLYRNGYSLDAALSDLRRLARIDLGDFFRFEYVSHNPNVAGETQPDTEGYGVRFDVYLGASRLTRLKVDLVVGGGMTAPVSAQRPENSLDLPRLITNDFRLYPIVDQVADKVCATMMEYRGRPSSREKDLVDLVTIATTQTVDYQSLCVAISTESNRRGLELLERFSVPTTWGRAYTAMAQSVPACAEYLQVERAEIFVADFVNPTLDRTRGSGTWLPDQSAWQWVDTT